MPDDNRLQGIGDKLESDDSDDATEAEDIHETDEANESQASQEPGTSRGAMDDEPAAFSYDETEKTTVYGAEETLSEYSKALDLARARAIEEYDLEDIEARELHNAALLKVAEDVDGVAEKVAEEREP